MFSFSKKQKTRFFTIFHFVYVSSVNWLIITALFLLLLHNSLHYNTQVLFFSIPYITLDFFFLCRSRCQDTIYNYAVYFLQMNGKCFFFFNFDLFPFIDLSLRFATAKWRRFNKFIMTTFLSDLSLCVMCQCVIRSIWNLCNFLFHF